MEAVTFPGTVEQWWDLLGAQSEPWSYERIECSRKGRRPNVVVLRIGGVWFWEGNTDLISNEIWLSSLRGGSITVEGRTGTRTLGERIRLKFMLRGPSECWLTEVSCGP